MPEPAMVLIAHPAKAQPALRLTSARLAWHAELATVWQ
jgi:hypothetical protein